MSLECKREAFKCDDGCPAVEVDLTFPDFDACETAVIDRLKGVSKLGLRKTPAFPTFVPGNDPFPVEIPDVEVDVPCVFDSYSDTSNSVTVKFNGVRDENVVGGISLRIDDTSCTFSGIDASIDFPFSSFKHTITTDGFKTITFDGLGSLAL